MSSGYGMSLILCPHGLPVHGFCPTCDGALDDILLDEPIPAEPQAKCDCGSDKCGLPTHAAWCSTQTEDDETTQPNGKRR